MNIVWNITKKRGNLRPVLNYTTTLTEFEKSIAMPAVRITSTIPRPPDVGWQHCWPGENERGQWTPAEFHLLMTPSYRSGSLTESLKLPWRENNAYPEVEASFLVLREAFEHVLATSANSKAMQVQGRLETSGLARKSIAPAVAAQRILKVVKG